MLLLYCYRCRGEPKVRTPLTGIYNGLSFGVSQAPTSIAIPLPHLCHTQTKAFVYLFLFYVSMVGREPKVRTPLTGKNNGQGLGSETDE